MKNLQNIKAHINSVKKTKTITFAMKIVAASKLKKTEQKIKQCLPYQEALKRTFLEICLKIEPSAIPKFFNKNESQKTKIIVFTGDKGLCGGFHNNIYKMLFNLINDNHPEPSFIIIGAKGNQYLRKKNYIPKNFFTAEKFSLQESCLLTKDIIESYKNNQINSVYMIFTKFNHALTHNVICQQLLPFTIDSQKPTNNNTYIYEPNENVLIDFFQKWLEFNIYSAYLENKTAEETARMISMDNATTNAEDLIKKLVLVYNKNRQALITKEISEIVSGVEALSQI